MFVCFSLGPHLLLRTSSRSGKSKNSPVWPHRVIGFLQQSFYSQFMVVKYVVIQ